MRKQFLLFLLFMLQSAQAQNTSESELIWNSDHYKFQEADFNNDDEKDLVLIPHSHEKQNELINKIDSKNKDKTLVSDIVIAISKITHKSAAPRFKNGKAYKFLSVSTDAQKINADDYRVIPLDSDGDGIEEIWLSPESRDLPIYKLTYSEASKPSLRIEPVNAENFAAVRLINNGYHNYRGDFNGDGLHDLLLVPSSNEENYIYISYADKKGTYKELTQINIATLSSQELSQSRILISDFNNDDKADLFVQPKKDGSNNFFFASKNDMQFFDVEPVVYNAVVQGVDWSYRAALLYVDDIDKDNLSDVVRQVVPLDSENKNTEQPIHYLSPTLKAFKFAPAKTSAQSLRSASVITPSAAPGDDNPVMPESPTPVLNPATSTTGSYTVTWTDVNVAFYEVWESTNGGNYGKRTTTGAKSYAISGRTDGTYRYQIVACNSTDGVYCSYAYSEQNTVVVLPKVSTPSISPAGGVINGPTSVSLTTATPSAQIFYSTNGATPTTLYSSSFTVSSSSLVKAVAKRSGYTDSAVASATFSRNYPPTISGSPSGTAAEGGTYSFTPTVSDPDGNTLTFNISGKPAWAGFDPLTGTLSGTPNYNQAGTYSGIVITVSDGLLSASLPSFSITVNNTNRAPTISGTPSTSVAENGDYTFTPTFSDPDGTVPTLSISNKPTWADFNQTTGTLSGKPNFSQSGSYNNITITASDGSLSSKIGPFSITVTNTNRSPTGGVNIAGSPQVNQMLNITNTLGDPDGLGAFSYKWYRDNTVISGAINSTYTINSNDVGKKLSASINYMDGHGYSESIRSTQTATISAQNLIPQVSPVSPISNSTLLTTDNVVAQATATDSDGTITQVEFRIDGGAWVVDAATPYSTAFGQLTSGNHMIEYRALDNAGSYSNTVSVNFSVNTTPTRTIKFIHTDLLGSPAAESDESYGNGIE